MRILVVDDANFMRTVISKMLESLGHEVVGEASNGEEAVEAYKRLKPDMVTMDITMAGMNGVDALKEIKIIDPQAKVIMCSAMGQQGYVLDAIRAGAIDFIVKPFKKERIEEILNKYEAVGV